MNSITFNQRPNLLSSSKNKNVKNAISKHWDILLQDSRLVNLYEKPIIAYTRSNNIKDIIIKSKYTMPPI
jgi:hypothetical protein